MQRLNITTVAVTALAGSTARTLHRTCALWARRYRAAFRPGARQHSCGGPVPVYDVPSVQCPAAHGPTPDTRFTLMWVMYPGGGLPVGGNRTPGPR
jgi:hypothetical protein